MTLKAQYESITFVCTSLNDSKLTLEFAGAKEGNQLLNYQIDGKDYTPIVVQYIFDVTVPSMRFVSIVKTVNETEQGKIYTVAKMSSFQAYQDRMEYIVEFEAFNVDQKPILTDSAYFFCARVEATENFTAHPLWRGGGQHMEEIMQAYVR